MENIVMSAISPQQIMLVAVVVILLFGAKKIPDLMKGVGKGIKGFKDEMNDTSIDESKDKTEE